jgi:hypothetical protein
MKKKGTICHQGAHGQAFICYGSKRGLIHERVLEIDDCYQSSHLLFFSLFGKAGLNRATVHVNIKKERSTT